MYSLLNVAPDDGLTNSETCRASNDKQRLITRIVHLVGLYNYCNQRQIVQI